MVEVPAAITRVAALIGCIITHVVSAPAAEPGRIPKAQVELAAQKLSGYFESLKGFEFRVSQETVVPSTGERFSETLAYAAQGSAYWFDYSDDGTGEVHAQVAFNGEYGQYLLKNSGRLNLQKGKRMSDFVAMYTMGFLQPFAFFNADTFRGGAISKPQLPLPAALGANDQWIKRLSGEGVTFSTEESRGSRMWIVSLPGGVKPSRIYQTTFKVHLDPARNFYPVKWERLADDGCCREVYEVDEFGAANTASGINFLYPKAASLYIYYGDESDYFCRTRILVSGVAAGKEYEGVRFTIDPASATQIYDVDTKIMINVR